MADEETEELLVVETTDGKPPVDEPDEKLDPVAEDDAEDEEDERLGASEEENDDEVTANRKRRRQRREAQRRAREAKDHQIDELVRHNAEMRDRLAAVEGHSVQTTISSIDERIAKALRDAQQAEGIEAQALTEGNGEDVVLARRVREAALGEATRLQNQKQGIQQQAEQVRQPAGNPVRDAWLEANPWFNANGGDRYSALARGIDTEIAREGFNPNSREYWQELTRRTGEAFQRLDGDKAAPTGKRNAPPVGGRGEHPTPNTRSNTIYLSPERKQAMIDAGVWDDPVTRQKHLKAYQEFDKSNAAR